MNKYDQARNPINNMNNQYKPNIRRLENGKWYWIEKAVIRQYASKVGVAGIAVYNYLASLANARQSCFPSQQHIADVLSCSRVTVNKAIKLLEKNGLISVDRSGRYQHIYHLLEASCKTPEHQVLKKRESGVK